MNRRFFEKKFWPVFELLVPVLYQKRTHFDEVKNHFSFLSFVRQNFTGWLVISEKFVQLVHKDPGNPVEMTAIKYFKIKFFLSFFQLKLKIKTLLFIINLKKIHSFVFVTRALRYRFTNALAPTQKYDLKESI